MSNAFRSHLMQQFAAAARNQSRPPIALCHSGFHASASSESSAGRSNSTDSRRSDRRQVISTANRSVTLSSSQSSCRPMHPRHHHHPEQRNLLHSIDPSCGRRSSFSSSRLDDDDDGEVEDDSQTTDTNIKTTHIPPSPSISSEQFQSIIKSRRTISNFLPLSSSPQSTNYNYNDNDNDSIHINHIAQAIERAAECAINAPNHHRTEPLTLKRILAPGPKADALTNVCYQVALRRGLNKGLEMEDAVKAAETKRDKWRETVSAFVVALVSGPAENGQEGENEDGHGQGEENGDEEDLYAELPFRAPQSERHLEDYASACASVQNILLSLHCEGLGTKWATGPVVRCRAFRNLVACRNDDLVVGLLMIGVPRRVPRVPRRRRDLLGDVLQDL